MLSEAWKQARWQAGGTVAGEAAWREAKNIPNLNDLLASLGCRATQEGARFECERKWFYAG